MDWCPRGLAITSSEIDVTSIKDENDESENVMGEIELHFLRSYQHLDLDLDLAEAHLARIAWTVPSPPPKGDAPNADGEASQKKRFLLIWYRENPITLARTAPLGATHIFC